jgi:two-component system, NarL family, sensor kinase
MTTIIITVTIILLLLTIFMVGVLLLYQRKKIDYQTSLESLKNEYEKTLLKTRLEIQEQTFQAISREIHDNINLSLTLAKLNLNTLDFNKFEKCSEQVGLSIHYVSKAINDLSDISESINSEIISNQGLLCALRRDIEKLSRLNCFIIQFNVCGDPVYLDAQKEIFIFRIIQEAFNNILKHAKAKNISLRLHYYARQINIIITDDGVGFKVPDKLNSIPKTKPTSGLRNMQKRAELLNGRYRLDSRIGRGTTIRITIPFYS